MSKDGSDFTGGDSTIATISNWVQKVTFKVTMVTFLVKKICYSDSMAISIDVYIKNTILT